ncbi:MAG TPA: ABC transporter substrate-binding protein, partial [Dehalococcoidia bacterium]|nr:ABC transporter substrate-binding protein [Dehalococcoidia bacterium]
MTWRPLPALLALAIISAPLAAEAQQASKPARIGVLCLIPCEGLGVEAFRRGLRDLGHVEGRTLVFEYRDAEWKVERLSALAADLVQSKVDVIFTPWGTAPALAAKRATVTIPVVIGAAGDPVRAGIVPSLTKPSGNVTGLSSLALELEGKRLELLKELVPKVSRVGVFWHSENPYSALAFKEVEVAARTLGVRLHAVRLSGPSDLETAFATLKRDRVEALVIHGYVATLQNRRPIIEFAAVNRLPAIYPLREYVDEGGLLSYGANVADISRRAAYYVDRILNGAKPADLPVEQVTTVQLVVNLKTAGALGVTVAPS